MTVAGRIDNDCHFAGQWQLAGILNVAKCTTWRRFFCVAITVLNLSDCVGKGVGKGADTRTVAG